ncbi:ECF transporter S component [Natronococcus pandeyae]|uniref:ECF transporter S component n=2 Tax=Natronococcus pandeyae TaxID=2055836 RepID=A0A8J8TST1_9EURY|nr:ECF transporter S component [Natronococcus pandeyae]
MSWSERIAADFTTVAWVLIPIAVGINVVGSFIVGLLRIPLFLDVIGTILIAILAGPWVAVVAGVLTNVVLGVVRTPTLIPFALVQVGVALVVGYVALRGWFRIRESRDYVWLVAAGLLVTVTAVVISTPIAVLVFGGLTGSPTDVVVGFFLAAGAELFAAVLVAEFIYEPIDKIASVFIAYFIAQSIPERYLPSFGQLALNET